MSGVAGESLASVRPRLFAIAYRMLGTVADAEDLVQEAFLRYQRAVEEGATIDSTAAYLSAVVTRLSIDELRSARKRREVYVGEWLPEPLLTDGDDPADAAEQAESLSMAFLLLLERLGPVERAVFLLHDAFGYEFDAIAKIVGKTPANCRQLAARARRHIEAGRPRFEVSREKRDALAGRFFSAVSGGDMNGLVAMLADDVVVHGDGGGNAPQWSHPPAGRDAVSKLFFGLGRKMMAGGLRFEAHQVNGQPGALVRAPNGDLTNVFVLDIADGAVRAIRSVINPEKLRHLGPVADVRALMRAMRDGA